MIGVVSNQFIKSVCIKTVILAALLNYNVNIV